MLQLWTLGFGDKRELKRTRCEHSDAIINRRRLNYSNTWLMIIK